MGFIDIIPHVNTALVIVTGVLLVVGRVVIRRGRVELHRRVMIAATTVFAAFLALYATRLIAHGPTEFQGEGLVRPFYFTFLGVHMVLALATIAGIVPMLRWALRGEYQRHKRLAVWVWPAWLVSIVMGVTVWYMLFVAYA